MAYLNCTRSLNTCSLKSKYGLREKIFQLIQLTVVRYLLQAASETVIIGFKYQQMRNLILRDACQI